MNRNLRLTSDHRIIKKWVEDRGGIPVALHEKISIDDYFGVIRFQFPKDGKDENYTHISWLEFFTKFDQANLAFQYQDHGEDDDDVKIVCKIISRDGEGT